ncbi:MAG: ABC transporter permease [Desulfatibacillum sp.]|nr:ABC transporter permease [Desulfatibacillum sp.]
MRPIFYLRQALDDLWDNKVLHGLAVSTISLIFLLAGAFALVFLNVSQLMTVQQDNVRMMVYLKGGLTAPDFGLIQQAIEKTNRVRSASFVSKAQALERLRESMDHQAGLLEGLSQNPLPDAFEVVVSPGSGGWEGVKMTAAKIEGISGVDEANYGQAWLEKFSMVASLARMAAMALGSLLLVAALSITANTIRLVLYNRRDEIRIMELVGATNGFIRASFYIQGMIQGFLGGIVALAILAVVFFILVAGLPTQELLGRFQFHFIPMGYCLLGLVLSVAVGAAGCHLSFAQFHKE